MFGCVYLVKFGFFYGGSGKEFLSLFNLEFYNNARFFNLISFDVFYEDIIVINNFGNVITA